MHGTEIVNHIQMKDDFFHKTKTVRKTFEILKRV